MNSSYKVRIRNSHSIKYSTKCNLGISLGSPYFEGDKLKAIFNWIDKKYNANEFDECYLVFADSIYKYTYMLDGLSEDKAEAKAIYEGDQWIIRNKGVVDSLNIPTKVIRWKEYAHRDHVRYMTAQLNQLYDRNQDNYKIIVDQSAKDFLNRRKQKIKIDSLEAHQRCVDFIINETSILIAIAQDYPSMKYYPGKEIEALKVIREGLIQGAPKGLENLKYHRLTVD